MPELAATTRDEIMELHLTEEDWRPAASWPEPHAVPRPTGPRLVYLSLSESPSASVDPPWTEPAWLEPTLQKLAELLRLPPDWSSYRAAPVRPELASALVRLLVEVMGDDTPPPTVVPTASGGVQAEWHRKGYDLEIEVLSPSRFWAYFEDLESGEVESEAVISDLRRLVDWIASISG